MVCAYLAFDVGVRIHLKPALASFGFSDPDAKAGRVRRMSIAAWSLSVLALVLLLLGVAAIAVTIL